MVIFTNRASLPLLTSALAVASLALVGCASAAPSTRPLVQSPALDADGASTCITVARGEGGGAVVDSRVAEAWPTANYGKESVAFAGSVGKASRRMLLRFDTVGVPANARITRATVTLHRETCGCSDVTVHRATKAWNEETVTWSSFDDGFDSRPMTSLPDDPSETGYGPVSFDATGMVKGWLDGSIENDGLVLAQVGGNTTFATSESDRVEDRPRLDICYEVAE